LVGVESIMFNTSDSWPMIGAKEFEHGQETLDPLAIYNFGVGVPWTVETAVALEGSQFEPATVFQRTCSGCHAGGGNILQPGATLFAKDLERNDTATVDDIFKITYSGKGRMPGYGENCTPRGQCTFGPRISDSDIHSLAEFVRLQADQGWSKTIDP
jgi:cytochrome c6